MQKGSRPAKNGASWTGSGRSMLPTILPGSRLRLAEPRQANAEYQVGDVVCFLDGRGKFTVHRVIGIQPRDHHRAILVAGDASGDPEEIEDSAILGVVVCVEHPLLSYDTRGFVGRIIAGLALRRSASFKAVVLGSSLFWSSCMGAWRLGKRVSSRLAARP